MISTEFPQETRGCSRELAGNTERKAGRVLEETLGKANPESTRTLPLPARRGSTARARPARCPPWRIAPATTPNPPRRLSFSGWSQVKSSRRARSPLPGGMLAAGRRPLSASAVRYAPSVSFAAAFSSSVDERRHRHRSCPPLNVQPAPEDRIPVTLITGFQATKDVDAADAHEAGYQASPLLLGVSPRGEQREVQGARLLQAAHGFKVVVRAVSMMGTASSEEGPSSR